MTETVIKTTHLVKKYRDKRAIDDLSVNISANGITGLIGRNGSGKTTFMKLCAGLLNKTSGDIEIFGNDPTDNLQVLSSLVYTYNDIKFENPLKLQDILQDYNIMFESFDFDFASKLLKYFDLGSAMKYRELSKGMTSVFNFICGLSCRTALTMFDEPVLGMDITVRKAAYEVLLRDYNENPRTIIISSHLFSEIENVLSDILLIDEGRLVLHENIDDLRQSAYMIEGEKGSLDEFCENKKVIHRKNGKIGSFVVVHEEAGDAALKAAKTAGLTISAVRPEDLFVYLTRENKEGELECLWQKTN